MARQPKWTRESAISYLAGNPSWNAQGGFNKPVSSYTTDYLKRQASEYQEAEQEGREISREEARGHLKIRHIEKREKGTPAPGGKGVLPPRPEQYSVGTREKPALPKHAVSMLKSRSKTRPKYPNESPIRPGDITGNITGILDMDYGHVTAGNPITLSFHITRDQFGKLMKDMIEGKKGLVDVANALSMQGGRTMGNLTGAHWVEAWQMNIHV